MKRLLFLAASFLCSLFSYATMTGSGTESDPFLIYDADDLNEVHDYVGGTGFWFKLANDIDLSKFSEGEGWEPIGSSDAPFMCDFDGDGHTISNLKINRSTQYVGLFGYATSTIKGVNVECVIQGSSYVGGICGYGISSSITDCCVIGNILGTGDYVGGICGYTSGDINKCKALVEVSGWKYVGGVVGYSSSSISFCYANGTINASGLYSGGIVGYDTNSDISDCLFKGVLESSSNDCGGIVGYFHSQSRSSSCTRCFTEASISGNQFVGGICGYSIGNYSSTISKCVAANSCLTIKSGSYYGRIVYLGSNSNAESNISLNTTKVICYGSEQTITSSDANNGKGIGNALLKRKATYTYLGWDFDEVWGIDEGTSYPYLRYFNPPESQSITFETPSLTYGDASFTLPATTEQGLTIKWTTSNENILTINGNILTIKGAGTCNLIATQLGDNTYKSIRETYPISIAKAPLIITADNYTRNVGEENPELTLTYSGFVNDEDETALKTPPIITTTATKDSPVGDYAITVSGAESDNYDITYKNGILTIIDETALRNTLAVNHTMLRPGKEATIDICLDNEDTMIAFEFYMQLPEGISITLDEDGYPDVTLNSTRANRHILEVADKGDGLYYFLCYSNSNAAIKGSNGELLSFNVDCDEEVAQGVYQGHIRSLKFSDSNENRIMLSNIDFDIEVSSVLKGDVNDDEDIDVIDVVTMVNYMIGRPSETFVFAAADHNDDGIVDVMDLVRQVSLVMSQSASSAPAINSFEKLDYGLSLVTDKEGLVNVSLADGIRYVATQFVVTLSKGQKLVGITTDDEHIVNILPLSDNRYFVMSYSMRNATFASNDRMLTLNVVGEGTVEVENVSLVDANEDKVVFQNVSTETTGINEVDVNLSSPMDIYSVNGSLLKKGVTTTENLRNGIYVINGKKVFVK